MADILDHLFARRSVRKFTDDTISDDDAIRLLQAAMAAPSATNRRPWEFIVVTEGGLRSRLRNCLVFGRYDAPMAIVVCGNLRTARPWPARDFWIQDCSAAAQNILLAAAGLALGAVWIGVHPISPLVAAVRRVLGLPKHIVPLGAIWIGHPAEEKEPRTQFDETRVHWNGFERQPSI